MRRSFKPPSEDRLAEVDVSGCDFDEKCIEIQGVVSPSSQGGWEGVGAYKVHCFSFAAWREVGHPLIEEKLIILRPVASHDEWSAFPELSIHRLRVLMAKDRTRAIIAKVLKVDGRDRELLTVAEELQKPVVISTQTFGDLILDRSLGRFLGRFPWNGIPIRIRFEGESEEAIQEGLKTAEALCSDQKRWKQRVDEFAIKELLPTKNDSWLDDNEQPLTAGQFKERMTLQTIAIDSDGGFEFWHDDGDLFLGHSIQICGSLKDGLTRADIPG